MLNKSVARRYAEAFFIIAKEAGKIDEFQQELEVIIKTIDEIDGLKVYLNHLLIPVKQKKETVERAFGDQISSITLNFFYLILDKRREGYFKSIVEEYCGMADESRNITKADLYSAREVPEDEVKLLGERLSASTGKTVLLQQIVDASLLGGIKLRVGDRIIDASVAKKLEMLKDKLRKSKIS